MKNLEIHYKVLSFIWLEDSNIYFWLSFVSSTHVSFVTNHFLPSILTTFHSTIAHVNWTQFKNEFYLPVVIGIVSGIIVLYHPKLGLPNSQSFQLLDSNHLLELYDTEYRYMYRFEKSFTVRKLNIDNKKWLHFSSVTMIPLDCFQSKI